MKCWLVSFFTTTKILARCPRSVKRSTYIIVSSLAALLLVVGGVWLSWCLELRRLYSPQSVVEETGLNLPEHARVVATGAQLFSLSDGNSCEWLIKSHSTLNPWAESTMQRETDGWEHIRELGELGFSDEIPGNVMFGEVWRADLTTKRGRVETSYLYLSRDGKVAILSTFRP